MPKQQPWEKMFCRFFGAPGGGGGQQHQKGGSNGGPTCGCCGRTGHSKKECIQKDCECHRCGTVGHLGYLCKADNKAGGQVPNGGQARQNPKKTNPNGPAPKPNPTQTATSPDPPPPPPQPHQEDWYCSYHHCQYPNLVGSKVCKHCNTPRQKVPPTTSPLTQRLSPTKSDKKLIDSAAEPEVVDGTGASAAEEESQQKYLAGLRKQQEIAIQFAFPQAQVEQLAADIAKLEAKQATKQTKNTADFAKSEAAHEETYQREDKKLKEEETKGEEAVRLTAGNRKARKEENRIRYEEEQKKIDASFGKFDADEAAKLAKTRETRAAAAKTHSTTMEQLRAARYKATGGVEQVSLQPAAGNILVEIPAGLPLISPSQLNLPGIQGRLEALAQPGQLIHGIDERLLKVLASLMHGMMEETAVLPTPFVQAQVPQSSCGPAAAVSHTPKNTTGKRPAEHSEDEKGTGEALAKQPKDVVIEDVDAEFENLG